MSVGIVTGLETRTGCGYRFHRYGYGFGYINPGKTRTYGVGLTGLMG